MKLKEFVKMTLLDITEGVSEAQQTSPSWIAPGRVEGEKVTLPQHVSFEVVVTTNKEGGGSISVLSMAEIKAEGKTEQLNRITFDVPVYFQAKKGNLEGDDET
ncbi:hypothetical protein [Paremcibacter congregatus]|uniref:hypothetical protein n=1 Tax=Paremcibacter congregatus TaxID=2043170 RepID=UPI0030EED61B|tara:strand:- start:13780 stop:14088 length:309 start_codon:yes stop_codon:yes gene_type:complete